MKIKMMGGSKMCQKAKKEHSKPLANKASEGSQNRVSRSRLSGIFWVDRMQCVRRENSQHIR